MLCSFTGKSQTDTLDFYYKLERCTKQCNAQKILEYLEKNNFNKKEILHVGSYISYYGNDKCANELMNLCIAKNDSITEDDWHMYSVQNTKHGNYAEAIQALDKSLAINAKEIEGYYGWVLLYYYRDYERSLLHLNHYDDLAPNDVEAPVGENIHFLKGLCYYQLRQYQNAIKEFELNETFEVKRFGQKYCNAYIYFYMARCYEKITNLKQAEIYYKKAIKYTQFPVEANYYLGMLYKYKKDNATLAMKYFKESYNLLLKGYKQQDIYVELFDEVYMSQLSEEFEY